jgi:hypothetical protein
MALSLTRPTVTTNVGISPRSSKFTGPDGPSRPSKPPYCGRAENGIFRIWGGWRKRIFGEREAWVADYTDQGGVRRMKTFARKKEADSYHAKARVVVRRARVRRLWA